MQLKSPLLKIGFPGSDLHGVSVLCISVMKFPKEAAELKNKQAMYANLLMYWMADPLEDMSHSQMLGKVEYGLPAKI